MSAYIGIGQRMGPPPETSEQERMRLAKENAGLKRDIIGLLRDLPTLQCADFHHAKIDQHASGEECPVERRFNAAMRRLSGRAQS